MRYWPLCVHCRCRYWYYLIILFHRKIPYTQNRLDKMCTKLKLSSLLYRKTEKTSFLIYWTFFQKFVSIPPNSSILTEIFFGRAKPSYHFFFGSNGKCVWQVIQIAEMTTNFKIQSDWFTDWPYTSCVVLVTIRNFAARKREGDVWDGKLILMFFSSLLSVAFFLLPNLLPQQHQQQRLK